MESETIVWDVRQAAVGPPLDHTVTTVRGPPDGCPTAYGRRKKLDFDFGMPDPYPKDRTVRFAHGGSLCAAHQVTR